MTYRFQRYGADPSLDPTGIASARLPMYGPYPTGLTYGPSGPVLGPATALQSSGEGALTAHAPLRAQRLPHVGNLLCNIVANYPAATQVGGPVSLLGLPWMVTAIGTANTQARAVPGPYQPLGPWLMQAHASGDGLVVAEVDTLVPGLHHDALAMLRTRSWATASAAIEAVRAALGTPAVIAWAPYGGWR